jgi:hypothetical protein
MPTPPDITADPAKDNLLRKLNHAEWLGQFAIILELQTETRRPMTPFRAGAISRLRMAAEYIDLLQREQRDLVRERLFLENELREAKLDQSVDTGR